MIERGDLMALIKEIKYEKGSIRIWDDYATKDPEEIEKIIERVSEIIHNYYRRQSLGGGSSSNGASLQNNCGD